jgi:hypothetical protein
MFNELSFLDSSSWLFDPNADCKAVVYSLRLKNVACCVAWREITECDAAPINVLLPPTMKVKFESSSSRS